MKRSFSLPTVVFEVTRNSSGPFTSTNLKLYAKRGSTALVGGGPTRRPPMKQNELVGVDSTIVNFITDSTPGDPLASPSSVRHPEGCQHEEEGTSKAPDLEDPAGHTVDAPTLPGTYDLDTIDTPGAGPSGTSLSAVLTGKNGQYQVIAGSGSRRSLRFENSKTSFLDVTDEVSNVSKYAVAGGGFCEVHVGKMKGEEKVALKRLRILSSSVTEAAKAMKVRAVLSFVPCKDNDEIVSFQRFRYEVEIWCCLNHPYVLRLYGLHQDGPMLYMVSPWQDNGPLSAYLKSNAAVNKLKLVGRPGLHCFMVS